MNQPRNFTKVASDMFFVQGMWAAGFLGVMLIVQIIKIVTATFSDHEVNAFFDATFIAANIFMLVIGIISAIGFIPHYVGNGVTRKDYFKGAILGTIGLSIAIPIVSAIVTSLFSLILNLLNLRINIVSFENNVNDPDGNIIGHLVTSVIFSPHIELSSSWLLAILIFALNIFTYYCAGWLIGSAFSRWGVIGGLLSIVIGFIVIQAEDILLSASLGLNVPSFLEDFEIPIVLSMVGIILVITICLWLIRQLTKRIIVKI